MRRSADWIKKHIFPGGQLPSVKALIDSACRTGDLYLHHLESFGLHYAKTLRLWRERFNEQADQVRSLGFDDAFVRKWNYYLSYCEAAFATRNINVGQLVLSRPNNPDFA
jgi:cyclopropane-fatty-acyl-phospholipid synthase